MKEKKDQRNDIQCLKRPARARPPRLGFSGFLLQKKAGTKKKNEKEEKKTRPL
jgi:hypothetical protein